MAHVFSIVLILLVSEDTDFKDEGLETNIKCQRDTRCVISLVIFFFTLVAESGHNSDVESEPL